MARPDAARVESANRLAKYQSKIAAGQSESILAFASRHGWDIHNEGKDYLHDYTLRKGVKRVHLSLFSGYGREIATARTRMNVNVYEAPMPVREPVRVRLERFLVGFKCICACEGILEDYELHPDPACPVHGEIQ